MYPSTSRLLPARDADGFVNMSPVAFYKLPVAGWLDSTSRRKLHEHDMFNFHRHVDITMIGQQVHNVSRIRKLLESRFADFKLSELCFAETRIADDRFCRIVFAKFNFDESLCGATTFGKS